MGTKSRYHTPEFTNNPEKLSNEDLFRDYEYAQDSWVNGHENTNRWYEHARACKAEILKRLNNNGR